MGQGERAAASRARARMLPRSFLNMLKLMQKKTLQLVAACGSGAEEPPAAEAAAAAPAAAAAAGSASSLSVYETMTAKLKARSRAHHPSTLSETSNQLCACCPHISSSSSCCRSRRRPSPLAMPQEALSPESLQLVDDSSKHAGHNAMNGLRKGETHFT